MKGLDQKAAEALAGFEQGKTSWTYEEASDWTRFMLSLLQRVPEEIAEFKASYASMFENVTARDEERYKAARWDGLPETFAEYIAQQKELTETSSLNLLRKLISHPDLIRLINGMVWNTWETPTSTFELLTSDRPVLTTPTLGENSAYILMPIGPRRLFAATRDKATMTTLRNRKPNELVRIINTQVVSHAVKYAYGTDHSQLRHVQNKLSKIQFEPIFSRLDRYMKEKRRDQTRRRFVAALGEAGKIIAEYLQPGRVMPNRRSIG